MVEAEGGRLRLIDVYPASPAWAAECLPPDWEHGGFLRYADRPAIVIRVPAALRVDGRAMDGGPPDAAARR